jgi:ATP-binding cassette subfamily B protein
MIAQYYGRSFSPQALRDYCDIGKSGVSLLGISQGAEKIGLKSHGVKVSFKQLMGEASLPCILHWDNNHFVVLPPQKRSRKSITIADPARGLIKLSKEEFKKSWVRDHENEEAGIALILEPTSAFYDHESETKSSFGWAPLLKYFWSYKKYLLQLAFGLLVGSLIQLVIPFLTQSLVDNGVNKNNLQFIYIVLIAQLMLFFGRTTVEFIRSKILLYMSTHINLTILSEFWIKLMRLPLNFFETRQTGDILQRLNDHQRIQSFLTGSALSTLFSLFNLVIFSFVLLSFNARIFFLFATSSILYFLWIKLFLSFRRNLDHKRFAAMAKENSATMQLIQGMREIKLNSAERLMRWEWETLQASVFNLSFKSLSLSQIQQMGAFVINEGKNILITFFVAKSVLDGQLTLGAMLAVQYIIGQLNGPIEQMIGFTQQAQDAKLSMQRLNEIHDLEDEEPINKPYLNYIADKREISICNLSFTYPGSGNEPALNKIGFTIPEGKVTAIVGMSGSGKTTILKLLLRFYESYSGEIKIGQSSLHNISPHFWRSLCGSVLQDGYIFNDTIIKNIAIGDDYPKYERVLEACRMANILEFVQSLPLDFKTVIGMAGLGISQGQKQRLLIARAIYKNPEYLFFDEATNALDANNEKVILENLDQFFSGRTVVVVAHRLSTVKNAHNIIVLKNGEIIENGTHEILSAQKGHYYELVKNQLELGN